MFRKQNIKASAGAAAARIRSQAADLGRRAGPTSAQAAAAARTRAIPAARQARAWTAATLDRSSAAVQETLGPRVSSALSAAASRVRPPAPPPRKRLRAVLRGLIIFGVAGAVAGVIAGVRSRSASYRPEAQPSNDVPAPSSSETPTGGQSSAELNSSASVGAVNGH